MMRTGARQIIFITLVATALCGDRVASALPVGEHLISETACRVVNRLADSFVRRAPARRSAHFTRGRSLLPDAPVARPVVITLAHFDFSPFQFRLPPPVV